VKWGGGLPVLIIQAGKEPGEMDFMSVLHWNNWRRGEREDGGKGRRRTGGGGKGGEGEGGGRIRGMG